MYHWAKYVQKKVTVVNGDRVKSYRADEIGEVKLVRDENGDDLFKNITKSCNVKSIHRGVGGKLPSRVPYRDFHHFREFYKPWVALKKHRIDRGPHELWFKVLRDINERYEFGIDVDNIGFVKPNLGLFPTHNMVHETKLKREEGKSA